MALSYHRLLHAILDIGEAMQNSGAEISRVEDSINRMCMAYGVRRVNSFTITANMLVSLEVDDDTVITQTRRLHQVSTDMTRLDRLNDLSRYICAHKPPVEEIQRRYLGELGVLQAIVEVGLTHPEIGDDFRAYLKGLSL